MFTGIVQGLATVTQVEKKDQLHTLTISFPAANADNFATGASVAINGTCLTITGFDGQTATFDVIAETLDKTNLGELSANTLVNFERAARIGDEIGGHLMSGHVFDTVTIDEIIKTETNCTLWFTLPERCAPYVLTKGFVGLNGCSLTIGDVTDSRFNVHLIPETLAVTSFGEAKVGQKVNLELDPQTQTIVDTVARVLANKAT